MFQAGFDALKMSLSWFIQNIVIINIILGIIIIFFERRNPTSVWAWVLVLLFFPIGGFILYLFFGQDLRKRKLFQIKEIEDEVNKVIKRQEDIIYRNDFHISDELLIDMSDLVKFNLTSSSSIYTEDNDVAIYGTGQEKFDALIEAMEEATSFIHIQYYIFRDDFLSQRICDVLKRKASLGVEVRILYDGMGCMRVSKRFWKNLMASGIKVAEFYPPFLPYINLRVNFRNHRKIVVIDGQKGFVGGFNVGKEYIGEDKKFGFWRDTHIRIMGSAVDALHTRFLLDWNYVSKENLLRTKKYFPDKQVTGSNGIQIVASGPDSKLQNIRNNYLRLITKAKKSIYIQTPYFIPDDAINEALKIAALSGVDVRVMIPNKPDHLFIYWASTSYLGELIDAGAKCYTYENGFLHSKVITVDGLVSSVGTANMDIRSFRLNFEICAIIYNSDTTKQLEDMIIDDISKSKEVTKYLYQRRSYLIRFKEQVCRLLSPML